MSQQHSASAGENRQGTDTDGIGRIGTRLATRRSLALGAASGLQNGSGISEGRPAATSSGIRLRRWLVSDEHDNPFKDIDHHIEGATDPRVPGSCSAQPGFTVVVIVEQMTGMGIVRAGPAVIGRHGPSEAPTKAGSRPLVLNQGGTTDPFSTAFVRPPLPFASDLAESSTGARQIKPLPGTASRPSPPSAPSHALLSPIQDAEGSSLRDRMLLSPSGLLQNARIAPHSPTRSPSRIFAIFDDDAASMDTDDKLPSKGILGHTGIDAASLPLAAFPSPNGRKRSLESDEPAEASGPVTPSKRAPKRLHTGTPTIPRDAPPASGMATLVGDVPPSLTRAGTGTGATKLASPLPTSPKVERSSPRSAPMRRAAGRVYSLPDLTLAPVPASPRSFVTRTQLLNESAEKRGKSPTAPALMSPAGPDLLTVVSSLPAIGGATGPASKLAPASQAAADEPSPSRATSAGPSTAAPVANNLILPTLSLFDRDRVAGDPAPEIDGDTSMSDGGDVSTVSSSTTTSSRADETARRLANLQSMLSQLQVPRPTAARISMGAKMGASRAPRSSMSGSSSSMPPPAVASNTARRASVVRAKTTPAAVSGSASAPSLHRGPPMQSGSTTTARRKSIAGPLPARSAKSSNENAPGSTLLRSSSAGNVPAQRAARGKTCLQGVAAFVDVRTAEGDDSGMIFVDMLKDLGARVTSRPSSLTTHIVFKSGKPTTLDCYRQTSLANRPHLVGIAWVVRCSELHTRVDESLFKIEEAGTASAAPGGGKENMDAVTATAQAALGLSEKGTKGAQAAAKRRKSMEPRALAALNNARANLSLSSSNDSAMKATIAASIERARRKSLQYAPRIGSPLAKRVFVMPDAVEEE
ncbi:hypothetical protein B0A53_04766 [Rhodotorula sp. CCFEE 5036]|nr:hypothetical protein B0A53_04766 [Rhodotorula sp. CCFEE 5036]